MRSSRRSFLVGLGVALGATLGLEAVSEAGWGNRHRRRVRRRVRRRIRRVRRHAMWRMHAGRRLLVVPAAVVPGWELMIDNRVAVVQAVQPTGVTVQYIGGETATVDVLREDNPQNLQELPGTEVDVEVEEEVEE